MARKLAKEEGGTQMGSLRLINALRCVAKSVNFVIRGQNKHLNFFDFHIWMLHNAMRLEESKRVASGAIIGSNLAIGRDGRHRRSTAASGRTGGRQNGTSKTASSALYECVRVMMIERERLRIQLGAFRHT